MSLVVRKIEYNKWLQNKVLDGEQPSADAITNCIRTYRNTLSVWLINDSTELEEAVLAIVSQFDHIDAVDFLVIEAPMLREKALELECNQGITPYAAFVDKHCDIVNLDYTALGCVAKVVVESIRRSYRERFTRSQLKKILQEGIDRGKIRLEDLKESLQRKLSPAR